MEKKNKPGVLLDNELQINRSIGTVLYMGCLVGPIMFLFTQIGIFSVETSFCLGFTVYAIVTGTIQRLLIANNKYHMLARYFGVFALEIMIGISATRSSMGIYMSYSFATLLSCLYVNLRYTQTVCVLSYAIMVMALHLRSFDEVAKHCIIETRQQYFLNLLFSLSIEFIFLFFISQTIVKYETQLLKSREEEVLERKEAEEKDQAKSDFLAQMSHEIRTPINAVLGMNEMILRETSQPEVEGYARTIKNAGKSLLNIVNDILDFSKIQSGKMEIVPVEYDCGSSLRDLIELYRVQAVSKGLDFEYQISKELPRALFGDEYRIKQAAGNLLSNAIKYTEKGFVNLQVDFILEEEQTEEKKGRIVLSVIDSGIGIKSEDIPKLFQNFGRLDIQKNRSIEGTGLGLKISKQLIEMMGGTLTVQSVYGEGSIFSIAVSQEIRSEDTIGDFAEDLKRQEESEISSTKGGRVVLAPKAKILVVDDNEMNLQVVSSLLKKSCCKVDCVLSGEECLTKVKETDYDLILLDHMMPQMDGIEVLHILRGEPALITERTRVVVLTANAIVGARENYLKEGFDDYLSKPIVIEELERVLMEHLPASKVDVVQNIDEEEEGDELPDLSAYNIDIAAGIKLLEDLDVYVEMAKVFYEDYPMKSAKMRGALAECNLTDYAIMVHGLKSNARTLGAMELGELAFEEETESKAGNIHYIQTHVSKLEEEWEKVIAGLKYLFETQGVELEQNTPEIEVEREKISKNELVDQLLITMACLEEYQEDEAKKSIHELLEYQIDEKLRKDLGEALEHLHEFDYNKAFEVLNSYIDEDKENK